MKLRTRGLPPPRRAAAQQAQQAADSDVEEQETPLALRRQSRRSVAPRLVAETPAPARARAAPKAPKGGVQKRKVTRPRTRPAAARTRRARPATPDDEPAPILKEVKEDFEEEGADADEVDKDSKLGGDEDEKADKEKRIATIDDLPEEVMLGIFSYFRPPQLCWKIGRVCQRWASWSVAPLLWRSKEYILSPHPNLSSRRNK